MPNFPLLTIISRLFKILIIILIIIFGFSVWQIKNWQQIINTKKIVIIDNVSQNIMQRLQELPAIITAPTSSTPIERLNIFASVFTLPTSTPVNNTSSK